MHLQYDRDIYVANFFILQIICWLFHLEGSNMTWQITMIDKGVILNYICHSYVLVHWLVKSMSYDQKQTVLQKYLKTVNSLSQALNSLFKHENDPRDDGALLNNAHVMH